ncbi:hypothetical protein Pla123a_03500 [Posidoniimonas polymericola]|uniref:STAS/SEC14 domain-containing protein n=1 Tax=Posidoniimonas polymericola TaxID=2528002 RepID=A0A5C5ZG48_9BACT|nr:STAS/SEC14 domain-containing protein [Posidoniimonas polymericola]TWT85543.1 hypothetical protein Pla123a_03500 [Posidoniimonas polymericola]
MSLELVEAAQGNLVEIEVTGKLNKEAYEIFVPEIEQRISEHGKIRVLVVMHDFHGWEAGALWEDLKFDVKHFNHIERLALVGESKWEKGMSVFCRPFTTAKIKYFDHTEVDSAREWVLSEA